LTAHSGNRLLDVVVPVLYDLYFSAILAGAAEAAHEHEMRLVLSPTMHEHAREASLLDHLMQGVTEGALIVLPEESSVELEAALNGSRPFVVVDPLLPLDARIPCVSADHRSGADQAMAHLLGLGHRRIGAIAGPPGWAATEDRRDGYHAALAAAGIAADPALEVASDFEFAPGLAAAAALLDVAEPPTAIFAFNDAIALGALVAAQQRGIRVPEDLSIVGVDDIKYATIVSPALTTIRQPLAGIGRNGVNLLIRLIEGERPPSVRIELPVRLVVRGSTAPPRER
jgi:LacI family transcriptional regulator, galactose operon repressor